MRAEWGAAWRLVLRHHPLCDRFDADRFGPFCSGCLVFWPTFAGASVLGLKAWLDGAPALALLAFGAVLGLPQLLTLRWRFGRPLRAAVKLLGGAGVAFALLGILLLPAAWSVRALLGLAMLASFVLLSWLRARSMLRTCDACTWRRAWGRCPGFVLGAPRDPPAHPLQTAGAPDRQAAFPQAPQPPA